VSDLAELGSALKGTGAEAGSAAARVAGPDAEVAKDMLAYAQRRGFAALKEAGLPNDVGQLGKIVGRELKSRADLTPAEWKQIWTHAVEQGAEKKAAESATAAAKTAITKAVAKTGTKAIKARERSELRLIPAASEVPPGTLQRLSEMNLNPQQLYDFWRQAGAQ
jgi:hypothetical protein